MRAEPRRRAGDLRPRRIGPGVVLGGILLCFVLLGASACGYWAYACSVPQIDPPGGTHPWTPYGSAEARQITESLVSPQSWLFNTGVLDSREEAERCRPALARLRNALQLDWRCIHSWETTNRGQYSGCSNTAARYCSSGRLAEADGDVGLSLQCALDASELGLKLVAGGDTCARANGQWLEQLGFALAEHLVWRHESLPQLETCLRRTRRLRSEWPPLWQTLEVQFPRTLASCAEQLRRDVARGFMARAREIDVMGLWGRPRGLFDQKWLWLPSWQSVREMLVPRRAILAQVEEYRRDRIADCKKPFSKRVLTAEPVDRIARQHTDRYRDRYQGEWAVHELRMLEAALAIRVHRLRHGEYPDSLTLLDRDLLARPFLDIWDQPILYRLDRGRPTLYSIGPDGVDDAGRPMSPLAAAVSGSGDLVFGRMCDLDWDTH